MVTGYAFEFARLYIAKINNKIFSFLCFRSAYVTVMKICKIMLTTVLNAKLQVVIDACNADPQSPNVTQQEHSHAVLIQQALQFIPNQQSEIMTKNVAMRLGQHLTDQVRMIITSHTAIE